VLKRIEELDYQPNLAARTLITGRSYMMGLVVPNLLHPFFTQIAEALSGMFGGARTTGALRSFSRTSRRKTGRVTCSGYFRRNWRCGGRFARRSGQGHVSTLDAVSRLEDRTNEMLYRREVEFARGHGTSVECEPAEGRWDHAVLIRTAAMPHAVVRTVEQREISKLVTDMKELTEACDGDLAAKLSPLTEAYAGWIAELEGRRAAEADLLDYADASEKAVERAREVLQRLKEGIALLETNSDAREAFRFANSAMWQQRVRSVWIDARKAEPARQLAEVDIPRTAVGVLFSWRSS
jgi:hypothetical protein